MMTTLAPAGMLTVLSAAPRPGGDPAADQTRAIQGHVASNLHQGALGAEHHLGEGGQVPELGDGLSARRPKPWAHSFGPAHELSEAKVGAAAGAELTDSAPGGEASDHVIAGYKINHPFAHGLDNPCWFMPQNRGGEGMGGPPRLR